MGIINFRFSGHALNQIRNRGLSLPVIESILADPDLVSKDPADVSVYQKIVLENNKLYLYRVFVNVIKEPPVVITAYKTSKTDKYENQIR